MTQHEAFDKAMEAASSGNSVDVNKYAVELAKNLKKVVNNNSSSEPAAAPQGEK